MTVLHHRTATAGRLQQADIQATQVARQCPIQFAATLVALAGHMAFDLAVVDERLQNRLDVLSTQIHATDAQVADEPADLLRVRVGHLDSV